jgi:hypothetical protein
MRSIRSCFIVRRYAPLLIAVSDDELDRCFAAGPANGFERCDTLDQDRRSARAQATIRLDRELG